MLELNKENFGAEVLEAEGLVFVDFWSPSCAPCMALLPEVEAFAEKNASKAKFCKLDSGSNKRRRLWVCLLWLSTRAAKKLPFGARMILT